jgi:hypothetical protein
MGVLASAINTLSGNADTAAKQVQGQLEMLVALASAKKDQQMNLIDERVAQARQKKEMPPAYKILEMNDVRVVSSSGAAQGITDLVNGLIFKAQDGWKTAISNIVNVAVGSLINGASGASEDQVLYLIALDGRPESTPGAGDGCLVPVRIDYCLWSYNISVNSLKSTVQSAIAYTARKYVLDYTAIDNILSFADAMKDIGLPQNLIDDLVKKIGELKKDPKQANQVINYIKSELPNDKWDAAKENLGLL